MTLKDELKSYVKKTHDDVWVRRAGLIVPDAADVKLGTDAVTFNGVALYADLADSTNLVRGYKDWFAAEIYKNYLYCASKIIKSLNGEITAFDGDRVMAVFLGDRAEINAIKAGLRIRWAVKEILQPAVTAKYPKSRFIYEQKVGIDSSPLFVARTGIRGSNDLVWVGNAANNAAKMAALNRGFSTYITETVFRALGDEGKLGGPMNKPMWMDLGSLDLGYRIYGSNWQWGTS